MTGSEDPDLTRRRRVAEAACRAAAAVHLKYRQPAIPFETKNGNRRDLVTVADREAQIAAIAAIRESFPDETIVAEEDSPTQEQVAEALCEPAWLVDPLDGTFNYVHGFPDFSATVGFALEGRPVVGATYAPALDEMFSAARGQGTTLNGKAVHVSQRKGLQQSVVNVWLGRQGDPSILPRASRVQQRVLSQRVFGGTAIVMAYLAAGRFDVFYVVDNPRMGPWDIAAGTVLIEEAGGIVLQTDCETSFCLPSLNIAAAADRDTLVELRTLLEQ